MEKQNEVKLIEWFDDHWYKVETGEKEDGTKEYIYIPSVTTKLQIVAKPFLARWRGDIGNREADLRVFEACERGVRIHSGWYTLATGGVVIYNPPTRPNYSNEEIAQLQEDNLGNVEVVKYQDEAYDLWNLQRWVEILDPEFVKSEFTVYSLTNKDAGTVDNIVRIKAGKYPINGSKPLELPEGTYVLDLKTGNSVDDSAFAQTAAYAKCYEELGLGEITGTLILHTGAKTKSGIEGLATLYRNKEQVEQDYKDYRLAAALWERKNADAKPDLFEFPALLKLKGKSNES